MSAVNEQKASGSGGVSVAAGMASSASSHRKSSGSSGSPVPASSLPPTELFPMKGLLGELLHQEAELWRRNELLMQSLRRERTCMGMIHIVIQQEWVCSVIGNANCVWAVLLWWCLWIKRPGHHPFSLLLCIATAKPLLIWYECVLGICHCHNITSTVQLWLEALVPLLCWR